MKEGARVGAVLSITDGHAKLLGYGTYKGDLVPHTDDVKLFGMSMKELGRKNPCIELDNGDLVYGCECWWGSEQSIKEKMGLCHTVDVVSIKDAREG